MDMIPRTINNRLTYVRPHATVLQACEAAGVDIPRFCYHEKLSVAGNCRRCLVEIQKSPKPVVSCAMPVTKGMVVFTDTPLVRKARESVLEFLLVNHPLDCPICDQGGECDLQDEALNFGADRGRYFEFKRSVEDKECGPIVKTIMTRCIHCTRCVRFSTEVAGNEVRGAFGRGEEMEIGTYIHSFIKTELSGNLVDLCPVGALTSKPYAFQARNWELQRVDSLDLFDAVVSDIVVHTRKRTTPRYINSKIAFSSQEEIFRILPRRDGRYSENWISDRTRYAFDGLKNSRITTPIRLDVKGRTSNLTWTDLLSNFSFWSGSSVTSTCSFVVGSQSNLERVYALSTFAKIMGTNAIQSSFASAQIHLDLPSLYSLNLSVHNLAKVVISGLILIGANPRFEASLLNTACRREALRRGLIYLTVGAFANLRYTQAHQGNSYRTLFASLENRASFVKERITQASPIGILLSVNSLRNNHASFLQKLVVTLGKVNFTKTVKNDRLGFLHSSVGSLAFAYFGLGGKKRDNTTNTTLFTVGQPAFADSFFRWKNSQSDKLDGITNQVAFDTHFTTQSTVKHSQVVPITSFYEREGHVRALDGCRRKHSKAVTAPVEARSLEVALSALCAKLGALQWFFWAEGVSRFEIEVPQVKSLNTTRVPFAFNPFQLQGFFTNYIKLSLFAQPVQNFYLQEPIASHSQTRAECSLFLGQEGNFIQEN